MQRSGKDLASLVLPYCKKRRRCSDSSEKEKERAVAVCTIMNAPDKVVRILNFLLGASSIEKGSPNVA